MAHKKMISKQEQKRRRKKKRKAKITAVTTDVGKSKVTIILPKAEGPRSIMEEFFRDMGAL